MTACRHEDKRTVKLDGDIEGAALIVEYTCVVLEIELLRN